MESDPIFTGVVAALEAGRVKDKDGLHRIKQRLARETGAKVVPRDSDLLAMMSPAQAARWRPLLRKKPMRTGSGVAIVAVMSSPAGCPHGKCIYCPGGPEVDAPQSYTGFEPSTMRAKRLDYDAYRIVRNRLGQLEGNGHTVDKVDIIIQGGTFPAREPAYRDWFVAGIYAGCNDGPTPEPTSWDTFDTWQALSEEERDARLAAVMAANEDAACRIIGLTIETKPDWCLEPHVDEMLRYGATRIELGIQTLDEATTALTNRGHTVQDSADALRIARDAGFKVCVHMMPGLPRPQGAAGPAPVAHGDRRDALRPAPEAQRAGRRHRDPDPAMDKEDLRLLFADPQWRPDMLKIYPTLVVQEGETTLKRWWKDGTYTPLDTAGAADVVAEAWRHIPAWCRVQRVDRDIPTTHVDAGVQNSNLRQYAEALADERGIRLRDIRAREVHRRPDARADRLELVVREYEASGGTEVFLSLEDPEADAIAAYLRLRRVGRPHRPEFQHPDGVAVVRELKVYGMAQGIANGDAEAGAWQHQGHGARLLAEAEKVASGWGIGRILVIAGVGVKAYYRRHGYQDLGAYVAKQL